MQTEATRQAPFRSEAFAEDLDDANLTPPAKTLSRRVKVLLGLMPAIVALMSAAAALRVPPA